MKTALEKMEGLWSALWPRRLKYIALLGLSRSDFFYKSAFYAGTALRMFYNLDRSIREGM